MVQVFEAITHAASDLGEVLHGGTVTACCCCIE